MRFKSDNLKQSRILIIISEETADQDPKYNSCNRLRENLQRLDLIIAIQQHYAHEGHNHQKNKSDFLLLLMMDLTFQILEMFTILIWIMIRVFTEAKPSSMNPIVTDPIIPTDLKISRVSLTGIASLSIEPDRTLTARRS